MNFGQIEESLISTTGTRVKQAVILGVNNRRDRNVIAVIARDRKSRVF